MAFLRAETQDPALAEQIKTDYTKAALDEVTRALLDFSVKVSKEAWTCTAEDLTNLRALGLTDEDILHAVQIISLFNYLNRIADALGVEPNADYATMGMPD